MSLFSRKKRDDHDEPVEKKSQSGAGKGKGKKKKDGMSTMLRESVIETVLDDFSSCSSFTVSHDGEQVYVGLYMDTADIGGISKKDAKDEDKGSIIEKINSGQIKTLITPELMESECIVFVPDVLTLDAMSEYGILIDAPYKLCFVSRDGDIELTDVDVSFDQVLDIAANDKSVSILLGEEDDVEEDAGADLETDDMFVPAGDDDNVDFQPDVSGEDDVVNHGDIPFPDDGGVSGQGDYVPVAEGEWNQGDYDDGSDYGDYGSGEYEGEYEGEFAGDDVAEGEDEPVELIPDEMVFSTLTRQFYSDDLNMEVSTAPFDSQFIHNNAYTPFVEYRGEGWLNEYLSQMARDANTELRRIHQTNLLHVRERYFMLVQAQCQEILNALDITNPESRFGQVYADCQKQRDEKLANLERLVQKRKDEIEDAWDKKLQQVGEDAAREAQQRYRDRFGRQHDDDLFRIESNIRDSIEDEFQDAVRRLHDERRAEASKLMDLGINETLRVISEMYTPYLTAEEARYKELQQQMIAFMDDNRKYEIARINTLSDELSQQKRADEVTADYTERIRRMQAEFESQNSALRADIQALEEKSARQLRERENELTARLQSSSEQYEQITSQLRSDNETLQNRVSDLLVQIANIDESKNREYAARINELQSERVSWEDKCTHIMSTHKKSNMITLLLAGVAVIAALSIGFILGEYVDIRDKQADTQSAILDEFNDRMDDIQAQANGQVIIDDTDN